VTPYATLIRCLRDLPKGRLLRLKRHVEKQTPILCGCEQAGDYFIYEGRMEPVMLACYENSYTQGNVTYYELHPDVREVYLTVADRVPHSGYANALTVLSQYEVREAIKWILNQHGI